MVDMRHQRQAGLVSDLERDVERCDARRARGVLADAHLDAGDDVAVGVHDGDRLGRRDQPHLLALADPDLRREAEDAGEGDVQQRHDPDRRRLDDVLAEAGKVSRPGAAGVDGGRDAAAAAELGGIDAERGAAPVDMGVEVDQTGGDDPAADVALDGVRAGLQPLADLGHLAAREGDVGDAVAVVRRVDDPAVPQDEIMIHGVAFDAPACGIVRECRRGCRP